MADPQPPAAPPPPPPPGGPLPPASRPPWVPAIGQAGQAGRGTRTNGEVRRILVVEDEAPLSAYIYETLIELGTVEVETAADGRQALAMIDAGPGYDLIMCDIIMPHMDGEALLQELRQRSYPAAVIMLTAFGQSDMIVRCLRNGACDYLVKPVGIEELLGAAANALQHMPVIGRTIEVEYDPHGWFEVAGESDSALLYKYRRFLGLLDKFRVPEPAASEVRLALEELGRNAIEWGNGNDRAKKVRFGCRILPGKIIVYIEDEGMGFAPSQVPDPSIDPLGHLENRKKDGKRVGGYGIHLIRNLMDKLVYNARGNRVVAIKYLDRHPSALGELQGGRKR